MSKDLGYRSGVARLTAGDGPNPYGNGAWAVVFDAKTFAISTGEFEIYHFALKGPVGSQVQIYVDRTFYEINRNGDVNSWNPPNPLRLKGGAMLTFYWNTAAAPTPEVTVWLRQPAIL